MKLENVISLVGSSISLNNWTWYDFFSACAKCWLVESPVSNQNFSRILQTLVLHIRLGETEKGFSLKSNRKFCRTNVDFVSLKTSWHMSFRKTFSFICPRKNRHEYTHLSCGNGTLSQLVCRINGRISTVKSGFNWEKYLQSAEPSHFAQSASSVQIQRLLVSILH